MAKPNGHVTINKHYVPQSDADQSGLLLNAVKAAEFLGISKRHFFRIDATAAIPRPVQVGMSNRRYWRRDELAAWVAASCPSREQWEQLQTHDES